MTNLCDFQISIARKKIQFLNLNQRLCVKLKLYDVNGISGKKYFNVLSGTFDSSLICN